MLTQTSYCCIVSVEQDQVELVGAVVGSDEFSRNAIVSITDVCYYSVEYDNVTSSERHGPSLG